MDANLTKQYAERLYSRLAGYDAPTTKGAVLAWLRDVTARDLDIPTNTPEAFAFRRSVLSPLLSGVCGGIFLTEYVSNNPALLQAFGDHNLTRLEVFATESVKIAGDHLHELATRTNSTSQESICHH